MFCLRVLDPSGWPKLNAPSDSVRAGSHRWLTRAQAHSEHATAKRAKQEVVIKHEQPNSKECEIQDTGSQYVAQKIFQLLFIVYILFTSFLATSSRTKNRSGIPRMYTNTPTTASLKGRISKSNIFVNTLLQKKLDIVKCSPTIG